MTTTDPTPAELASALAAAIRALIRAHGVILAIADIDDIQSRHAEWIRTATNDRAIDAARAINAAGAMYDRYIGTPNSPTARANVAAAHDPA